MAEQGILRRRSSARTTLVSLVLLAVGIAASVAGDHLIVHRFPGRPTPRDLLFELLPYVSVLRYATAGVLLIAFALFAYYAVRFVPSLIPEFLAIFSLVVLLRAVLMILTPLADAQGQAPFVFKLLQHGMFPSGHTATTVLLARLVDGRRSRALKVTLALLAVSEVIALLLAHGHYSVDIAGGFLLAYFVEREWRDGRLFNVVKRAMGIGPVSLAGASPLQQNLDRKDARDE